MKPGLTLILGGAGSGKSRFAVETLKKCSSPVVYLASYRYSTDDKEMILKIKKHRAARPAQWKVVEAPFDIVEISKKNYNKQMVFLLDCLTLYISGLMMDGMSDRKIISNINNWLKSIKNSGDVWVIVSNEVGMAPIPSNPVTRRFRELAGKVHQKIAKHCDAVYLVTAGIPQRLK